MAGRKKIYVEIRIRGPIDRVWELTQTPQSHQRWDVRFTEIDYLPRPDAAQPQRFRYVTRIGFGVSIAGAGETAGSHDAADGSRSSALRFWSDDPKSLIREGAGYWKYQPDGDGTRFLTAYDYDTRFGPAGAVFDRLLFRPMMAWATAWSFDRLRLWIEHGLPPEVSLRCGLASTAARCGVAAVWLYQGAVPKIFFLHPDELLMLSRVGVDGASAANFCRAIGAAEMLVGIVILLRPRWRWPLWMTCAAMIAAQIVVTITASEFLKAPFNPTTLNVATFLLATVALLLQSYAPSAGRCVRRMPRGGT